MRGKTWQGWESEPPHYLTNMYPEHEWMVAEAAERSGQKVVFDPMPLEEGGESYVGPEKCQGMGCLIGYEKTRDYSAFWKEYDALRDTV